MAAAAILENTQKGISLPTLDRFASNLMCLWRAGNICVIRGPKCQFLKIQDGGGRHLKKYTKGHISANSWSIYTKFGVRVDTGNISFIRGQKCHFLKIQDGGGHHLNKYTKGHISANPWSICIKFGVLVDTGNICVIKGSKYHFLKI